jgi:hypothetical protein
LKNMAALSLPCTSWHIESGNKKFLHLLPTDVTNVNSHHFSTCCYVAAACSALLLRLLLRQLLLLLLLLLVPFGPCNLITPQKVSATRPLPLWLGTHPERSPRVPLCVADTPGGHHSALTHHMTLSRQCSRCCCCSCCCYLRPLRLAVNAVSGSWSSGSAGGG